MVPSENKNNLVKTARQWERVKGTGTKGLHLTSQTEKNCNKVLCVFYIFIINIHQLNGV